MASPTLAAALEEAKANASTSFVWSGKNLTHFPEEIAAMPSLTLLDLSNNSLRNIPNLSSLQALQTLKLADNEFTTLGTWIGELRSLTELDVSENSLTYLPEDLPEQILSLNASNNRISTLPESITRLKKLQILKVSNNDLPKLPVALTSLESLETLAAHENRLTSLPGEISSLSKLKHIDISKNKLLKIPMDLYKLPQLETLSVAQPDLADPPVSIVRGGKDAILAYMKSIAEDTASSAEDFLQKNPQYKVDEPEPQAPVRQPVSPRRTSTTVSRSNSIVEANKGAPPPSPKPTIPKRPPIATSTPTRPPSVSAAPAPAGFRLGRSQSVAYSGPVVSKRPAPSPNGRTPEPSPPKRPLNRAPSAGVRFTDKSVDSSSNGQHADENVNGDPLVEIKPGQSLSRALSKLVVSNALLGKDGGSRPVSEYGTRTPIPFLGEDSPATVTDAVADRANNRKSAAFVAAKELFAKAAIEASVPNTPSRPTTPSKWRQPSPQAARPGPSRAGSPMLRSLSMAPEASRSAIQSNASSRSNSHDLGEIPQPTPPEASVESAVATVEPVEPELVKPAPTPESPKPDTVPEITTEVALSLAEPPLVNGKESPKPIAVKDTPASEDSGTPSDPACVDTPSEPTNSVETPQPTPKPTKEPEPTRPIKVDTQSLSDSSEYESSQEKPKHKRKTKKLPKQPRSVEVSSEDDDSESVEQIASKKHKKHVKRHSSFAPKPIDLDSLQPIIKTASPDQYVVEKGRKLNFFDTYSPKNLALLELDALDDYRIYFHGKEHFNFIGEEKKSGNIAIVSVLKTVDTAQAGHRVLIRSCEGDRRGFLHNKKSFNTAKDFRAALTKWDDHPELAGFNLTAVHDPVFSQQLLRLDKKLVKNCYKVGVVYRKSGQTLEEEMLGNDTGSDEFNSFLSVLGDKTKLKGFDKYDGGLDTIRDATGTHCIYAPHEGTEIMFHVSTLLPAAEGDMERIQEKKVHIGNDVIVVVYIEGDEPFSPEVMRSQFNHVFIVVRALKDPTRKLYQVNVAYKSGVDATSPAMPTNAAFEKNSDLRKLLLSKIINSERSAYQSPGLSATLRSMRYQLLSGLLARHKPSGGCCAPKKSADLPDDLLL